jgi:hypothetical protein
MSTESHVDGVTCRWNHLLTSDRGDGERTATDEFRSAEMCSTRSAGMQDICVFAVFPCGCCLLVFAVFASGYS